MNQTAASGGDLGVASIGLVVACAFGALHLLLQELEVEEPPENFTKVCTVTYLVLSTYLRSINSINTVLGTTEQNNSHSRGPIYRVLTVFPTK